MTGYKDCPNCHRSIQEDCIACEFCGHIDILDDDCQTEVNDSQFIGVHVQ